MNLHECTNVLCEARLSVFVGTSVVNCLLPQDPLQVFGPDVFHFPTNCLDSIGVLSFPLPEPDLKTKPAVTAVLGHAYVRCLNK